MEKLVQLTWNREPVGPIPLGMLYVDKTWEGKIATLEPGYYKLLANNDLTVTAEGEDGRSFLIGEISFAGFTPDTPEKVVQSLTLIKENPIVGVILLGVTLVSLSVTAVSCSVEININNCKGNCGDQEN